MARLGGGKTGVTRYRGTGPRAILSHCSLAHSGAWKPLMARMPEVDGTALDLPGHGMSAYDPDSELQRQGADAVLEALDDGPAHLIGHSFGARVVLRAALDRPHSVLSLTLIEPMMFHLLEDAGDPLYAEEMVASTSWAQPLEVGDLDAAGDVFTRLWGDGSPWDAVPERQRAYARERMPLVLAAGPDVMGHPPGQITLAEIAALPCPITLVSGAETRPAARAICELIARATGGAHHTIAGAGHMAPITHPEDVASVLRPDLLQDA